MRIQAGHSTSTGIFRYEKTDRQISHVGRIVLYSNHLLVSIHLEVSIKTRDSVNTGFEVAQIWPVIEGRGHVATAGSLRRKKHSVRSTEQFAHRRKVMTAKAKH